MKNIIAVIFLVFSIVITLSILDDHIVNPTNDAQTTQQSNEQEEIEVNVTLKGEIVKEGTYTILQGEYLQEAFIKAGGVTDKADEDCFDYYLIVNNDIELYIPPVSDEEKISINYSDVDRLTDLNKIGVTIANAIVEYRDTNGPFTYLEEIMKVSGIGKGIFESNKDKICL